MVAKFDTLVVSFGDLQAAAPLRLSYSDAQASKGSSRWSNDREFDFEFENDLPPGTGCTVNVLSSKKSASSALYTGSSSYTFNSGGPFFNLCGHLRASRLTKNNIFSAPQRCGNPQKHSGQRTVAVKE